MRFNQTQYLLIANRYNSHIIVSANSPVEAIERSGINPDSIGKTNYGIVYGTIYNATIDLSVDCNIQCDHCIACSDIEYQVIRLDEMDQLDELIAEVEDRYYDSTDQDHYDCLYDHLTDDYSNLRIR